MKSTVKRYPPVDIDQAFALSALADRINNGRYINMDSKRQDTKTNKEIMQEALAGQHEITDQDRERGQLIRDHFQGLLFKKLQNNLNGFENTIAEIIGQEKVAQHQLGVIAALPVSYVRDCKKDQIFSAVIQEAGQSQHLPKTTTAQNLAIKILDFVELKLYNCFTVTAVTLEGNLVGFYMKEAPEATGQFETVKARIKNYGQYKGGVPITYLNYVKFPQRKSKESA